LIVRLWLALALLIGGGAPASAHLLPAQTATMNVVGDTAYFVVSVPLSALRGIDDDRSEGVSQIEIGRHSQDIAAQFDKHFHVSSNGIAGQPLMTMAWSPQTEGPPADSAYVVVLHSERFAGPPQSPVVSTDLFGTRAGETQMTMTAKRDKREDSAEVAILRPGAQSHMFFRGGFATFADFIRVGIEHILSGPDHLLFLLTIVAAVAGWRAWLGIVTSFTIAHSVTMTLAALDMVRVSPALVEPGIAASIVLMAFLNAWSDRSARAWPRVGSGARIATVFVCGLLHGFGFASAIGAMAAHGAHQLATLAGFNLGVELGQFLFLGAALTFAGLIGRFASTAVSRSLPRAASAIAGVLGGVLLIERLLGA
jgi:hypothetical protein